MQGEAAVPLPTLIPTPSPTPEPVPETRSDIVEGEDAIRSAFYELLITDTYTVANPDAHYIAEAQEPAFTSIMAHMDEYKALAARIGADAQEICEYASEAVQDIFPDSVMTYRIERDTVNWKYIASLLWLMPEEVSYHDFYDIGFSIEKIDNISEYAQSLTFCVSIRYRPYFDTLYALAAGDRDHYMSAEYIMAYGTTVYDDDGNIVPYSMPELSEEYVSQIHKPLKGRPVFYDRWYQGRSNNSRLHTGLDLHARKNAKIYSCTDGTVLYYGYRNTPGYYVVIRDDQGYEYHYYHMSKESAFLTEGQTVKAGDLIGYVGNTGNSDINHLHLALITPDCRYVRLYSIMKDKYTKR